jgi:hypothetical protein
MDDAAIFGIGDFNDAELAGSRREPSRIVNLASAGGIEGGVVEDQRRAAIFVSGEFADHAVEVVEERVVVVETIGHSERLF